MNLKTVMALAIAAAFAAPVLAQAPGKGDAKDSNPAAAPATGGFSAIDRNNDGYISRDEARDATWNTRFSELDKDNDGRLSQSEFDAMDAAAGATGSKDASSPSPSGVGDKPAQKQ